MAWELCLYQLSFNAHHNPSCHQLLQKLLPVIWCSSFCCCLWSTAPHTPMLPSRLAGRFWFSLLDYKHIQLQMLPPEHIKLCVCRFRSTWSLRKPGNIHPNKLCSNLSSAWGHHELCKVERSQPGEAVVGAVGQQCLAGQYRRHHALLCKNKAFLEKKRWRESVCVKWSPNWPWFCAVQPESRFY